MRGIIAAVVAGCAMLLPAASAQKSPYAPPRTTDGKPDLGGVWTSLADGDLEERADGVTLLVISPEAYAAAKAAGKAPDVQTVNGELRTSLIVDPPDGKLPFRDRKAALAWREKYGLYVTGKAPMPDFTAGPDTLPNRDRCLMAANAAAPPMTRQGYNDSTQIVQTPAYVLIAVEMMDEARIIPVVTNAGEAAKAHRPSALPRWTGDSVGWWEDDTFVVETVNIDVKQGRESPTPMSKDARVVERFTRASDDELLYQTEVTDPAIYTRSWKTESNFRRSDGRIWEYACHEGNYGMVGILSGVRKTERDEAKRSIK